MRLPGARGREKGPGYRTRYLALRRRELGRDSRAGSDVINSVYER